MLCETVNSSSDQITCQLGLGSGLLPNILYDIEVLVKNQGYALQNDFYQISFESVITDVSVNEGSISGGTLLVISGDGFSHSSTFVNLDLTQYSSRNFNVENITYDTIVFSTKLDQEGTFPFVVNTNGQNALCMTHNCNFTFSSNFTPIIGSISPITFSSLNTTFTITGSNFGNDSVHVTIGKSNCLVQLSNDTYILCLLDSLNLGPQSISILADGKDFYIK